jgi:hypothetical protein
VALRTSRMRRPDGLPPAIITPARVSPCQAAATDAGPEPPNVTESPRTTTLSTATMGSPVLRRIAPLTPAPVAAKCANPMRRHPSNPGRVAVPLAR